jgi:DNA polymerase III epsilon subunit-like protein
VLEVTTTGTRREMSTATDITIGEIVHDFEADIQSGRVVAIHINEDGAFEVAVMRAAFADVVSGARSLETQLYEYSD